MAKSISVGSPVRTRPRYNITSSRSSSTSILSSTIKVAPASTSKHTRHISLLAMSQEGTASSPKTTSSSSFLATSLSCTSQAMVGKTKRVPGSSACASSWLRAQRHRIQTATQAPTSHHPSNSSYSHRVSTIKGPPTATTIAC